MRALLLLALVLAALVLAACAPADRPGWVRPDLDPT